MPRSRRALAALLLLTSLPLAGTAATTAVTFRDLKVAERVAPGLWSHTFSVMPANPVAPASHEQGCQSAQQLQAMMREAVRSPSMQTCPVQFDADTSTHAHGVMHCPAMTIAQLGITVPAMGIPVQIDRIAEQRWEVILQVPATPGGAPAGVWRHVFQRLGDCPR